MGGSPTLFFFVKPIEDELHRSLSANNKSHILAAVASQAIAGLLSAIISILIVAMLALYIVHSISITVLQFAILVERTVAFWKRRDYDTFGPHIGYAFTAICVVISLSSTYWAASVMDLEERTTFCSTATSRTADRVTLLAFAISGVNIITLVGILTLFAFNKSAAARRGYDLQTSYQLRENVHVIRIILPLSMFQAFCYALFSIPSGMVSMFRDRMSMVEYRTIFTIAYAIPYYTVGAPVLISFIIKRSQQIKAAKLVKLTRPAGRDDEIYFQAYTGMWKNVPAPKK
ncbi:integral membrane protein, C.elegans Sra family [Ancylostoma ceylanicum]|uniref:Integral membrane protein, C.elegans Sra family n=1 Tax=Ancylostoma ceylanicum TaxID=53326 RepID=A0A0D6M214_9BILA|nr:integral membrane protein, C.elegans Sra family [Ancylostoma ceylanicum]